MIHFLRIPGIIKLVMSGFFVFFFFSCGNEKAKTNDLPEAAEAAIVEQVPSNSVDQTEKTNSDSVQQSAITQVIYSQRYDGSVPY